MNCQNHPDVPATAYCRTCGKPVCDECRRDAYGTVYCAEHAPVPAAAPEPPPAAAPPPPGPEGAPSATSAPPPGPGGTPGAAPPVYVYSDVSPGLAFLLGWIPGVGAIYNGQYAKGLVHAVVWGILVSITNSQASAGLEPVFGILIAAWMFYMAFEAYHTARKRRMGEPVDEYSSLVDLRGNTHQVPVAGIALIVVGVLLLLHTLHVLDFDVVIRYWPVLLIAAGVYLLYARFAGRAGESLRGAAPGEVRHER